MFEDLKYYLKLIEYFRQYIYFYTQFIKFLQNLKIRLLKKISMKKNSRKTYIFKTKLL